MPPIKPRIWSSARAIRQMRSALSASMTSSRAISIVGSHRGKASTSNWAAWSILSLSSARSAWMTNRDCSPPGPERILKKLAYRFTMNRQKLCPVCNCTPGPTDLPLLSVDGSEHDVDRPDEGDDVGQHRTIGHVGEDAQVHEVWGADAEAVRQRRTVGDDVVAELPLGPLDRDIDLSHRRAESLDDPDEVTLHVLGGRHRTLVRRDDVLRIPVHQCRVHPLALIERLGNDFHRLPHLLHADEVAVIGVPVLSQWHLEIEAVVNAVGHRFADVVVHAGAAQTGSCQRVTDCSVGRDDPDSLGAGHPER